MRLSALLDAISSSGCAIVCLQKTKKPSLDNNFIKIGYPRRFDKFAYIPSRGASGGIATIWDSAIFYGEALIEKEFALVIRFSVVCLSVTLARAIYIPRN